jgi:hypothetical protein
VAIYMHSDCDIPCPGNRSQTCGGHYLEEVYYRNIVPGSGLPANATNGTDSALASSTSSGVPNASIAKTSAIIAVTAAAAISVTKLSSTASYATGTTSTLQVSGVRPAAGSSKGSVTRGATQTTCYQATKTITVTERITVTAEPNVKGE